MTNEGSNKDKTCDAPDPAPDSGCRAGVSPFVTVTV